MNRRKTSNQRRKKPVCVGSGLLALDLVVNGSTDFEPRTWAGGSCGNVLTILSYFGWDTYPVARIGTDAAAKRVLTDLERFGVHTKFIRREKSVCTPVILQRIRKDDRGVPHHTFSLKCPVCGRWYPTHRPITVNLVETISDELPQMDTFYFDRVSPGILRMAKKAYDSGALVVFEPSSKSAIQSIERVLCVTHVLKYSVEQFKLDRSQITKANLLLIVETLGADGLRFRHIKMGSVKWRHLKSFRLDDLQDVAGAGDWCSAAIIDGLRAQSSSDLENLSIDQIQDMLYRAQAFSAINCRYEGARGAMYAKSSKQFQIDADRIMKKQALESAFDIPVQVKVHELLRSMCPNCSET